MTRIFINYRREDCPAHAGRLADTLETRFGKESVFMDVDNIDLGVDFVERIEEAISDCDIVLALIGDEWLTVTDHKGRRRLDNPDDFVRLEISTALAREDVRVIPVLVEGAEMPDAEELPEALLPLARRNGIELTDTRWRSDTSVLIGAIERTLRSSAPASSPPAPPTPAAPTRAAASPAATPQAAPVREAPAPAAPPPAAPAAPAAPPEQHAYEPRKYLWIVPALLSLGGLTLIAFGQMARERRWTIVGVLYLIPVTCFLVFAVAEVWIVAELSFAAWFLAWPAALVHVVTIRPLYVAKVRAGR